MSGEMAWIRQRFTFKDHRGYMVPLARILQTKKEAAAANLYDAVADLVGVTAMERSELPASGGKQPVYRNRIQFARQSLVDAGVVAPMSASVGRGIWTVTKEGLRLLNATKADRDLLEVLLRRAADGQRRRAESRQASLETAGIISPGGGATAEAQLPDAGPAVDSVAEIRRLADMANDATYSDLLENIQAMDPIKFEHLAGDVLKAALRAATVRVTPPSRDDGIDGVLTFDDLGIRTVVFQAKRYAAGNTVDRPAVDQFWAAIQRQRASYGIFVTTSEFTKGATNAATDFGMKLVDGKAFVELMTTHSIGARTVATFSLYEVDVTWNADAEGE